MSTNIDDRVVKMEFDESGFTAGAENAISVLDKLKDALNLKGATAGLNEVQNTASKFNMDGVSDALENSKSGFSAFEAFATGVFMNLGATVSNFALNKLSQIPKMLTQGITDGFGEYQMQMGSIQTILSNTRDAFNEAGVTNEADQIDIINDRLNELNKYADDTIYNFSQMTKNIGLFTAAGVDLDTSVTAIKGLSNLAAVSGADASNASRAMYQMSQAMSTGVVKLMDWNSLVNAGMGGKLFQDEIKRVAENHGIAVDSIIAKQGSFRESLSEGWLTADIFNEALQHLTYNYDEVGDAAWEAGYAELTSAGYSDEAARSILELGKNATEAATKVRTWSQLWDTVGEAIGSGWAQTWQIILGDFLEATELFTWFSEKISDVVGKSADARNSVLQMWADAGGRQAFVDTLKNLYEMVEKPLTAIANAFSRVFGISSEQLYNITTAIATFTKSLVMSDEAAQMFEFVMEDVFTVLHSILGVIGNVIRVIVGIGEVVWSIVSPALEGLAIAFALIMEPVAKVSNIILAVTDVLQHFAQKGIDFVITKIRGAFGFLDELLGSIFDSLSPYLKVFTDFGSRIGDILRRVYRGFMEDKGLDYWNSTINFAAHSMDFFLNKVGETVPVLKPVIALLTTVGGAFLYVGKMVYAAITNAASISDAFDNLKQVLKWVGEDIYNSLPEPIRNAIDTVKGYFDEFTGWLANVIPEPIKNFASEIAEGFGGFINFVAGVADDIHESFSGATPDVNDLHERIQKFIELVSKRIAESDNSFLRIIGKIKETFSKIVKYFTELNQSGGTFVDLIIRVFKDMYNGIAEWLGKISGSTDGWVSKITGKLAELMENAKGIPGAISGFFSGLAEGDAGSGVANIINNIKEAFSGLVESLTPENFDLSTILTNITELPGKIGEGVGSIFDGAFDFSGLDVTFPDFSNPLEGFFEAIRNGIDSFPTEGIQAAAEGIQSFGTAILGVATLLTGLNFVNSLATLNRSFGKTNKGFAEILKNAGEALGEGVESIAKAFGSGFVGGITKGVQGIVKAFDPLGKKTASAQFLNIAEGLLMVAGALFVLAQIPAEQLSIASKTLLDASLGIVAIMAAFSIAQKNGAVDVEGVGKTFQQIGAGIALVAASMALLTVVAKLDTFDIAVKAIEGIAVTMAMIIGIMGVLIGIGKVSADSIKASAAVFVAMGAALLMASFAIGIMAIVAKIDPTGQGIGLAIVTIGMLTFAAIVLAGFTKVASPGALAAAGAAMVLLAVALTLMTIPILILGGASIINIGMVGLGMLMVAAMALFFTFVISLLAGIAMQVGPILAGSAAMVLIAAALTLAVIPIVILANVQGNLAAAIISLGFMTVFLIAVVGALVVVSTSIGAIAAGAAGMILLAVAVGLMALAVGALAVIAAMDLGAMISAVVALGVIFAGLVALSWLGVAGAGGLIAMAGAITLVAFALAGLFAVISYAVDNFRLPDMATLGQQALNLGENLVTGFLNGIGGFLNGIAQAAADIGSGLLNGIAGVLGIHSPSTEGMALGEYFDLGMIEGLLNGEGGVSEAGESIGQSLLGSFDGLDEQLFGTGEDGIGSLLDGWMSGEGDLFAGASNTGDQLITNLGDLKADTYGSGSGASSSFFEGFMSNNVDASSVMDSLSGSLSSGTQQINVDMNQAGQDAIQAFADGFNSGVPTVTEAMASMAQQVISSSEGIITNFQNAGKTAMQGFAEGFNAGTVHVSVAFVNMMGQIMVLSTNLVTVLRTAGTTAMTGFNAGFSAGIPTVVATATRLNTQVLSTVSKLASTLRSAGANAVGQFNSGLASGASGAASAMSSVANAARNAAGGAYNGMYSVGRNAVSGFVNGMNSLLGSARAKVNELAALAERAARERLKIKSPSRVFKQIGAYVVEGFILGIDQNENRAADTASGLAVSTIDSFANSLDALSINIDDILDTDYNPVITPVINSTEFDSTMDRLSALLSNGMNDAINIGDVNYNGQFAGKLDGIADINQQTMAALANNGIDYNRLGASVANALISAGVHVEMEGGELVGYLAGTIADVRRMYG